MSLHKNSIIKFAKEIYKTLGTGHQEYIYHRAMLAELQMNKVPHGTEHNIRIDYKGYNLGTKRLDLVIYNDFTENKKIDLIIELKSVIKAPGKPEIAQIRSYLKNTGVNEGIIINFPQPPVSSSKELPTDIQVQEVTFIPA